MDRRGFLTAAATAASPIPVAGCDGVQAPSGRSREYTVDVANAEASPLDYSASITDGGYASPDAPLTVEVVITNSTEKRVVYGEAQSALFYHMVAEDEVFVLVPTEYGRPRFHQFTGEHWTVSDIRFTLEYRMGSLEPGETRAENVFLAARDDVDGPTARPDEMTFSTTYKAATTEEASPSNTLSQDADVYAASITLTQY